MKLAVSKLAEGENSLSFQSDKEAWLREVMGRFKQESHTFVEPLKVEMHLTKLEPDYFLRGRMLSKLQEVCSRCAEPFTIPLDQSFEMALSHVSKAHSEGLGHSDDSDELDLYFFEGPDLELSPIIQEQLQLGLPYQPLCRENCRGICQTCGKNFNQGPCECRQTEPTTPFSVLKNLKTSH